MTEGTNNWGTQAIACLNRLDSIYATSPSAQMLVSNAPAILQSFKEWRMATLQCQSQLEMFATDRAAKLKEFQTVAPGFMKQLDEIKERINRLQDYVRQMSETAADNPNAKTVIDYTNNQILQQIGMYNNIAILLLSK